MKTEMDILNMDERQRLAWFRANRVILLTVGMVWLGMIAWEILHHRTPLFMIVMIPIIAAMRFGLYRYFLRMQ